jgi:hypothetical protein
MNTHKSTDNTRHKGQLDKQWSQNTAQKSKQQEKQKQLCANSNTSIFIIWMYLFIKQIL